VLVVGAVALCACQQRTGVLLTVHAGALVADQLRVTAAFEGRTLVRTRPETPSADTLGFPEDLFAEFDARPRSVSFTVEALRAGQVVASAAMDPIDVEPGQIFAADVDLDPPGIGFAPPADQGASSDGAPPHLAYASVVLSDHPVAYYRLDEPTGAVAHDSSGNGLNGTYGAQVTRGAPGLLTGDPDLATTFNGGPWSLDQIVVVPADPRLEPTAQLTVELWLRQRVFNPDFTPPLAYGGTPDPNSWPAYGVVLFQKALGLYLETASGQAGGSDFLTTTHPNLSQIYHFVETYDGSTVRMYIDGALESQKPFSGPIVGFQPGGLGIGSLASSSPSVDTVFAGDLDEVAVYDVALSPARISAHYLAGLAKLP
jgi:hypothetical protein